jgi:adenosine deaminase
VVLASRDLRVVSFDLAGPEAGHPASRHLPAIRKVQEAGFPVTLHAGEAGGVAMIAEARFRCRADRIGHGVDIVDDCVVDSGEIVEVGPVAAAIRDRRVPLEVCPTSNLHTKGWTPDRHPVGMLHRAGFTVTINTDNRLMSATSMPAEFELLRRHHGFGVDDLLAVTRRALVAAFCSEPVRRRLWDERIAPGYREAGAEVSPL